MINIAIDGPAGAGKSTIAKAVSKKLKYIYVDTGALYRAIALYINKNNIDYDTQKDYLNYVNIEIKFINGEQQIFLNSENITNELRSETISMLSSKVSQKKYVREFLLSLQRSIASNNNIIMDGRDIGSVILPDAQIKIFLTASAETRAKRRVNQLLEKNFPCSYEKILKDIIERDNNDFNREIAPLKKVDDATLIDTSKLNLEQSIELVYDTIMLKLNSKENKIWVNQNYTKL